MSDRKLIRSEAGVRLWEVSLRDGAMVVEAAYYGETPRTPETFGDPRRSLADAWFDQEVARVRGKAVQNAPR